MPSAAGPLAMACRTVRVPDNRVSASEARRGPGAEPRVVPRASRRNELLGTLAPVRLGAFQVGLAWSTRPQQLEGCRT